MIILYNPVSSAGHKPVLPMALLALGGVLEGAYPYVVVDGNLEADALATMDRLVREGASCVGVTVMGGPQLADAVPVCRALMARHPHVTIIWGGYFPTQHYEACLRAPFVDWVIRGHGERTFRALIDALFGIARSAVRGLGPAELLTNGTALPGLAGRMPDGSIAAQPPAPIPDIEALPDFPYHRVAMERYVRPTFMGRRTIAHHSSYGCPFRCNFCAVVNMVDGRWKAQSAERTATIVRRLVREWQADAVEFYDNNFFVNEARTAEFAGRIRDLEIGWWGEARVDTLMRYSDHTWSQMRESGLRMVFLGAESGSDETLRRMNKGGTVTAASTLDLAARMRSYGIIPEFSFVLGSPPEPEADAAETMSFIRRLKQVNPAAEIVLYLYTPVPLAGELLDGAESSGFAFPETLEEWVDPSWQAFAQRRSRLPWLADPLHRRVRHFERVLHAYYPTTTDHRLRGIRRAVLRAAGAWRYRLQFYHFPIELYALQKLMPHQRPETAGF